MALMVHPPKHTKEDMNKNQTHKSSNKRQQKHFALEKCEYKNVLTMDNYFIG